MKQFLETMKNLSRTVKLILALPFLDIVWNVTRLCRSLEKNNMVGVAIAAALVIFGAPFVWIIDLVCIYKNDDIWWID